MTESIYGSMGIDAHKGSVEEAFGGKIDKKYPYAWVNITEDPMVPGYGRTTKIDGDGSKPTQHYLECFETGNANVFEVSADDAHAMVMMDAAAAGFVSECTFGDTIDMNQLVRPGIKKAVVNAFARRIREIINLHCLHGIYEEFLGGETADLPSQVPGAYICNGFLWARVSEHAIIQGITQPGDTIWGVRSYGQASWENVINSGIMCNGITLASSVLMWEGYNKKYPFLRHEKNKYRGRFRVDDKPECLDGMTVSQAIRSGTRQWAIFLKVLYDELESMGAYHLLHGVSANTGGGASKILRLGHGIQYVKAMPAFSPIFQLIQEEGNISTQEMLEDFNCGIGLDLVGSNEGNFLQRAIYLACEKTFIDYTYLGSCRRSNKGANQVVVELEGKTYTYP